MVKTQLLAALALGLSMSAQAADFTTADAKYALRDTSIAAAQEARAAYKAILDQGAKDADLIRAAEGYLRATIFEGNHYYTTVGDTDRAARKKIFNDCWKVGVEAINEKNLGFESPVYYYYRAACIAYEAEVSTPFQRLALLPDLNKSLEAGLPTQGGRTYEGGGLLRVKAAVKGNPEAIGLPGGIYNPDEALKLIDEALEKDAYPGNAEGALFCENFRRKIITLKELKRPGDAKIVADQALTDFPAYLEEGLIPEFIRAETVDCVKHVTALKATL
ncbi:MAG TPA: hypothetical protein VE954_37900 [Oligoflexus sp.]|uniref:hypothetical protein n=1 Tax=Oligoflexus sp. TaxID=1971216 RepID=UPI002D67A9C3|nr:hypothetical protein [Oligoflexus sp.]HYX38916.1 hypothetical protein [Oligoflexus sp.]